MAKIKEKKKVVKSLMSIKEMKKELRRLRKEELRRVTMREREEIRLIKERAKQDYTKIHTRFEEKERELGRIMVAKKQIELQKRVTKEKGELERTNKTIGRITKDLEKIRKV